MRSGRTITEEDRQRARDLIKRVDAKIKKELGGLEPKHLHRWRTLPTMQKDPSWPYYRE